MDLERHPWAREGVTIPAAVLASIEAQAIAAYGKGLALDDAAGGGFEGEEACGVLIGAAGDLTVDAEQSLPNLANRHHALDPESYPRTGRTYFLIDPLKFSRLIRDGEAAGRPVKVLWHSHLDCGAYFSETDAATALAGGDSPSYDLAFLVVSVRGDGRGGGAHVDDRRLFVFDEASRSFVAGALTIG